MTHIKYADVSTDTPMEDMSTKGAITSLGLLLPKKGTISIGNLEVMLLKTLYAAVGPQRKLSAEKPSCHRWRSTWVSLVG